MKLTITNELLTFKTSKVAGFEYLDLVITILKNALIFLGVISK